MTSELRVFAQSADVRIDIDAWNAHATRFFATRLGFAEAPRRDAPQPDAQAAPPSQQSVGPVPSPSTARLVITPNGAAPGIRSAYARACEAADVEDATLADARAGPTGLALLARRCRGIWVIDREGPSDGLALRLAAIVASLVLGPIFDPEAKTLFGVKTARAKIEANH